MELLVAVKHKDSHIQKCYTSEILDIRRGEECIVKHKGKRNYGKVAYRIGPLEDTEDLGIVVRKATKQDRERYRIKSKKEREAFEFCRERIEDRDLDMKLIDTRLTFDEDKAIFYFSSDHRVDFRKLVKDLAHEFKIKIEMKQIGVRDKAQMIDGYGPCGKRLCCSQFIEEFHPISIDMAKDQDLSLIPSKISGSCDRLKCCLRYEHKQDSDS